MYFPLSTVLPLLVVAGLLVELAAADEVELVALDAEELALALALLLAFDEEDETEAAAEVEAGLIDEGEFTEDEVDRIVPLAGLLEVETTVAVVEEMTEEVEVLTEVYERISKLWQRHNMVDRAYSGG